MCCGCASSAGNSGTTSSSALCVSCCRSSSWSSQRSLVSFSYSSNVLLRGRGVPPTLVCECVCGEMRVERDERPQGKQPKSRTFVLVLWCDLLHRSVAHELCAPAVACNTTHTHVTHQLHAKTLAQSELQLEVMMRGGRGAEREWPRGGRDLLANPPAGDLGVILLPERLLGTLWSRHSTKQCIINLLLLFCDVTSSYLMLAHITREI